MKALKYSLLIALLLPAGVLFAQEHSETISKEMRFSSNSPENVLFVENIIGSVEVEMHNSDLVLFEVEKIIRSKNQDDLKKAIEELSVEFSLKGDSILSYLKAPFINSKNHKGNRSVNIDRNVDYEFEFNYRIKVPKNTNVNISTVNGETVKVSNLTAKSIIARNVNGSVELDKVSAEVNAKTVNGDIIVNYSNNGSSIAETVNGDIEVHYMEPLSAVISFSSLHGDLYTDLDSLQMLPGQVEENKRTKGSKTTYTINKNSGFKTGDGKGQVDLNLKTLNGDVIVKKAKS